MRSAVLFVTVILSSPALAQVVGYGPFNAHHPPPDWIVRGFEAAVADPTSIRGAMKTHALSGLAEFVPSQRAGAVIDKLLPLPWRPREQRAGRGGASPRSDCDRRARGRRDRQAAAAPWRPGRECAGRGGASPRSVATGERAGAVIDKLLPLLGDQNSDARVAAAQALGQVATGERAGAVIDKLLPLLGDQNSDVRTAAAQALGQLATGERAGAVIDKLLPLLGDPEQQRADRGGASPRSDCDRRARGRRDRQAAAAPWRPETASCGPRRRKPSVRIATGERAGAVIDKLLPLLGDPDSNVRAAAAQALGQIATGERAGAVIDKLLPLLGDQDSDVRTAAAQALGQIATGERAGAVIDKLLPLLGDQIATCGPRRRKPSVSLRPASARAP